MPETGQETAYNTAQNTEKYEKARKRYRKNGKYREIETQVTVREAEERMQI